MGGASTLVGRRFVNRHNNQQKIGCDGGEGRFWRQRGGGAKLGGGSLAAAGGAQRNGRAVAAHSVTAATAWRWRGGSGSAVAALSATAASAWPRQLGGGAAAA